MHGERRIFWTVFSTCAVAVAAGACAGSGGGGGRPLEAPAGVVAAADSAGQVTITWNDVDGAKTYSIYWATASGVTRGSGNRIGGVASPHTHVGLSNATTYYYVVTALKGGGGESAESSEVSATPMATPTGVSASGRTSRNVIDWSPVTGATSYNLYWSTGSGVTKATGNVITGVVPPYTHVGLSNGSTYYYVITAVSDAGGGGESAGSSEVFAHPLLAPQGVMATSGSTEVTVMFTGVPDAASYNLYWSMSPGVTKSTGTQILGVSSPFLHTPVVNGVTLYYLLTAVNSIGGGTESDESAEVAATPENFGIPDSAFGGSGWIVHSGAAGGSGTDVGRAVTVDGSGRILVAGGSTNSTPDTDMAIWRFDSSGSLDATFGTGGFVVHDGAAGASFFDLALDVAIDGTGRIVAAGVSADPNFYLDLALWRYDPNGTLDSTFGTGGVVTHDSAAGGGFDDVGYGLENDPSGRIVVAGYSIDSSGNSKMVAWRYDTAGVLDASFGTGGVVVGIDAAGGGSDNYGFGMALDGSGRILVTGASVSPTFSTEMALWRLDQDGLPDTTFGVGGAVTHDGSVSGPGSAQGTSVALDTAGKIVVGGSRFISGVSGDMAVWRILSTGARDFSFGSGGMATYDGMGAGSDASWDLVLEPSGKIVVAGYTDADPAPGFQGDIAVVRFLQTGALDGSFGTGGAFTHHDAAGGDGSDFAYGVALDALGRILVTGQSDADPTGSVDYDMVLMRLE